MAAVFEFLFKYRPYLFEKGTLALHPRWSWHFTLLFAAAALLASYFMYRHAKSSMRGSWRFLLSGLRLLPLLILILISLQPVLVLRSIIPQKNFVAVAYDTSRSMEIRDGAGGTSRLEVERKLLRPENNPMLEELGKKFKLRFFRFSSAADRVGGFEDPPRHGNRTDLDRVLNQVAGELSGVPVSGIVLLTDGADKGAADLKATAAKLHARGISVYPVGIGSAGMNRDTEVLRVDAPRRVLKDSMIEAEVSIRSRGYAGRKTRLVVSERGRTVHSQEIGLGGDGDVKTFKVSFPADTAGPAAYSFRIEPFREELIRENNRRDVLIRVEDEQPKILYVEGEPRWIFGFLRRATLEDKNLRLVSLLRQADGKYYRQGVESASDLENAFPVEKPELFRYKGLILGSIEASFFTYDQLRMISDFVSRRGGGLLMLGGKNSFGQGGYAGTPLEDVLPVRLLKSGREAPPYQDVEFRAGLTDYGLMHAVTRLASSEAENRKRWESAPALFGYNPTGGAKPGATVLAEALIDGENGENPVLLAFQRFGRGKSMALTTASTWRWRMEQEHTDNFHELLWRQMLRWLVGEAPDQLSAETEKQQYALDENVTIRADVKDGSFLPLNNAHVSARVKSPSGRTTPVELTWNLSEEGIYTGSFQPREDGIYEVSVEASLATRNLGKAKAAFGVGETFEEFHDADMNSDLLRRLADETGGRFYTPDTARHLGEDISYVDSGAYRVEEKELWDMPILFLLMAGAASAEWALRKKKGLA